MKFLVLLKWKPAPPPAPNVVLALNEATKAWISACLESGQLDCAYNVLPSAAGYYGMGIGSAASLEEEFQILSTYPAFFGTDFEVYPLSNVAEAIDNVSATIRKMAGG
jgi:hypothetical protein